MGATALWLRYHTPRWRIDYNHEYVGENYTAEVRVRSPPRFEPTSLPTL
jgi:hypothetical protein